MKRTPVNCHKKSLLVKDHVRCRICIQYNKSIAKLKQGGSVGVPILLVLHAELHSSLQKLGVYDTSLVLSLLSFSGTLNLVWVSTTRIGVR